jgi:ketosteroid isomerase-like protein
MKSPLSEAGSSRPSTNRLHACTFHHHLPIFYPKSATPLYAHIHTLGSLPIAKELVLMRRPFAVFLLLSSLALPQSFAQSDGDESKIIALENLWNQIQMAHDGDAMANMVDDDFVLTDFDGSVLNKSQFLVSIRDKSNVVTLETTLDMKLHRHGDTVVVTGGTHEKGTIKGKPYEHRGRFTDTWIKHDGQWLCVASQLSLLPKSL